MKLSQYNSQKDPAMCFVGVTTSKSFVNRVFSSWVEIIGVNANLIGLDLALDSSVDIYRSVVNSIKSNDMILGSLVTSHKTNIYQYCNGLFDIITPGSEYLKEIGVIYKDGKQLACDATDPDAQMQVLKRLIPYGHWGKSKAQALILGAGGAGLALAYSLLNSKEQPTKIIITEINSDRIYQTKQVLKRYIDDGLVEVVNVKEISADTLLSRLPRGSLVANATGMGKIYLVLQSLKRRNFRKMQLCGSLIIAAIWNF